MLGEDRLREALTFDDVLLLPAESDVLPKDADPRTPLTSQIPLWVPPFPSAMDTVTEAATAICMAREGGIGIVHKNLTIEEQATEVVKVKKAESGIVVDPVTIHPEQKLEECIELMTNYHIRHLPVEDEGHLVGLVSMRDVMEAIIAFKQDRIDRLLFLQKNAEVFVLATTVIGFILSVMLLDLSFDRRPTCDALVVVLLQAVGLGRIGDGD